MNVLAKQISSLEKIRGLDDLKKAFEYESVTLTAGERYSYQLSVYSDKKADFKVKVKSELSEYINLY